MAQERSIFNRQALERLNSPDDLDKFVQVTNPSVWAILAACLLLLGGLLAWGVFGTVSTSVSSKGVVTDGKVACYLSADDAAQVEMYDEADVGDVKLRVVDISSVPSSRTEAIAHLGSEYLASLMFNGDWNYLVTLDGQTESLSTDRPFDLSIVTDRKAPIKHLVGGDN